MKNLLKKDSFLKRLVISFLAILLIFFINSANASKKQARKIYNKYCISCHLSGSSGAPRFKRQKEWALRILQTRNVLYKHAIEGFGKMEPKGGFPKLTDEEVKIAVDYILDSLPKPPPK